MKYLLVSDIHGSFYYASKAIEAFNLHKCDKILLMGDILYHGPRNELPKDYNPKKVIELLNSYKDKIITCRGNCDAEVDQMVLDFPITCDMQIINEKDYSIYMSHGHIFNPDNLPLMNDGDIFIFGHIHVPKMYEQQNKFILNPGSISLPKENSANSYGILEDKNFKLFDIEHNLIEEFSLKK